MCATCTAGKQKTQNVKNTSGISTLLLRLIVSTEFNTEQEWVWFQNRVSRDGSNSVSTVPSLKSRQALVRFHLDKSHFWSWRSTLQEKRHSICPVLRVDPFRLIMLKAAEESQRWICCHVEHVSSASQIFATSSTAVAHPCLHRLQTAQQPTQLLRCWVRSLTASCLLQWVGTNQVCPPPTTQFHSR